MLASNSILQNRYRVVRELGHGGMGTVYEAVDQRLNCVLGIFLLSRMRRGVGSAKSGREQAREAVESNKQKKLLDEIVARSHVTVAENFTVTAPPPSVSPSP